MPPTPSAEPREGQLFLSRPPYLLVARIRTVRPGRRPTVEYDLLDGDGSQLVGPVVGPIDETWSSNFQPLVPRLG